MHAHAHAAPLGRAKHGRERCGGLEDEANCRSVEPMHEQPRDAPAMRQLVEDDTVISQP